MTGRIIIPLNGLPAGKSAFSFKADKEFFEYFDNSEILDAQLDIQVVAVKLPGYLGIDCTIDGELVVACDRCLEDLEIPVHSLVKLSVKSGPMEADSPQGLQDDGRETLYIQDEEPDLDLSQTVYDYSCLSVPLHHVHEDGKCNPETVKYLNPYSELQDIREEAGEMPFAGLKALLGNKDSN